MAMATDEMMQLRGDLDTFKEKTNYVFERIDNMLAHTEDVAIARARQIGQLQIVIQEQPIRIDSLEKKARNISQAKQAEHRLVTGHCLVAEHPPRRDQVLHRWLSL